MKQSILIFAGILALASVFSFAFRNHESSAIPDPFRKKFVFVSSGTVQMDNQPFQTSEFYMSKNEVTNAEYNEFLREVRPSASADLLSKIAIQSGNWETVCSNKPLVLWYNNRKEYREHPVVNVSYEGALAYCQWLTSKANAKAGNEFEYEFRLPAREEWIRAAEGNLHQIVYAWGGPNATNNLGCDLRQCNRTAEQRALFETTSYTCPTRSYSPNSIGLYNMNGNAAEMTTEKGKAVGGSWASKPDDVKNQSVMTYQSPSPFVGFRPVLIVKEKRSETIRCNWPD